MGIFLIVEECRLLPVGLQPPHTSLHRGGTVIDPSPYNHDLPRDPMVIVDARRNIHQVFEHPRIRGIGAVYRRTSVAEPHDREPVGIDLIPLYVAMQVFFDLFLKRVRI